MPLTKRDYDKLISQIEKLRDDDRHAECITLLEAVPPAERDYRLNLMLAGSYVDSAMCKYDGPDDFEDGRFAPEDISIMKKALGLLHQMQPEGKGDPEWNLNMGMALACTGSAEDEFMPYLRIALGDDFAGKIEALKECDEQDENSNECCYGEEDKEAVDAHISKWFGDYDDILCTKAENGRRVDICVIPPTKEKCYYTLVTMGSGAEPMDIHSDYKEVDRVEFVMKLPADWKLSERALNDPRWSWPLNILNLAVDNAHEKGSFIYPGQIIYNEGNEPFARGTDLCGTIFFFTDELNMEGSGVCTLKNGDEVNFLQIVPLYKEEMDFIEENELDEFLARCPKEIFGAVDQKRLNIITGETWKPQKQAKKSKR